MTTEQRVRVDRLERYLITDRGKTYTRVRVNDLDTALSLIKEQQEGLEKKDKQIDLMAKFIENNMSEKKIINEICIKSKCNNEECHEDDLKDCIKQYFANKVNSKIQ